MIRAEVKNKGVEVFCSGNKQDLMNEFVSICGSMKKILTEEEYKRLVLVDVNRHLKNNTKTKEQKEEDFFKSLLLDLLKEAGKDPECDIEDFE